MADMNASTTQASLPCWFIEPYGAPTERSEVNRIPGFYTAAAQMVFAPDMPPRETPDRPVGAEEAGILDQLVDASRKFLHEFPAATAAAARA